MYSVFTDAILRDYANSQNKISKLFRLDITLLWYIKQASIRKIMPRLVRLISLILLHFVTFDSVTKMLCMSFFFLCNKDNHLLLGMWLLMDIAAYLCTKIVYFYGANSFVRPLTEVGTFFCCPVYIWMYEYW